jgi:uncharacterized protein YdcH (DUF465 family)
VDLGHDLGYWECAVGRAAKSLSARGDGLLTPGLQSHFTGVTVPISPEFRVSPLTPKEDEMMKEEEIKEQLMASSAAFRRLAEEHHQYEGKLLEINNRQYMSQHDRVEEVTLKKKKLQLKDQMNSMIAKLREELSHQPS